MNQITALAVALLCFAAPAHAAVTPYSVPAELQSSVFTVTVNGTPVQVGRAVNNVYYANFDFSGSIAVSVTAGNPRFWDQGVIASPMVRRIFPKVNGSAITFSLSSPAKLSIERPGNRKSRYSGGGVDTILCLFANAPEVNPPSASDPNVVYIGPGTVTRNITLASNQTLYVHGNAFVKGCVNAFNVQNAKIRGRGVIFYYDAAITQCLSQEGSTDQNTRTITVSGSQNLSVEGVILITRSTRWQVLAVGSTGTKFDNVKVVGEQEGKALNYCIDGIDARCDMTVNDCFLHCSDNIFGFWGSNFTVTNSYCWTLGANLQMIDWAGGPWTVNVKNFVIRNCDVINLEGGLDECVTGTTGGSIDNLVYDNLRCEWIGDLCNISGNAKITNHLFKKVWILNPTSPGGTISGSGIDSLVFEKFRVENKIAAASSDTRLTLSGKIRFFADCRDGEPTAIMSTTGSGPVTFTGTSSRTFNGAAITNYRWDFGDGDSAFGATVTHGYARAGTYRTFLTVTDNTGKSDMTTLELKNIAASPTAASPRMPGGRSRAPVPRIVPANGAMPVDGGDIVEIFDARGARVCSQPLPDGERAVIARIHRGGAGGRAARISLLFVK